MLVTILARGYLSLIVSLTKVSITRAQFDLFAGCENIGFTIIIAAICIFSLCFGCLRNYSNTSCWSRLVCVKILSKCSSLRLNYPTIRKNLLSDILFIIFISIKKYQLKHIVTNLKHCFFKNGIFEEYVAKSRRAYRLYYF